MTNKKEEKLTKEARRVSEKLGTDLARSWEMGCVM